MDTTKAIESRPETLGTELIELARIGAPIVVGYVATQMLGFVDTAMVGRIDAVSLAGVAIGNSIWFTMSILGMGLVLGMDPLVAQAIGAGDSDRARAVLWQAIRIAVFASVPIMMLALLGATFVHHFGIDAETSKYVFNFTVGRLFGIVPFLVYTAGRTYLQAIGHAGSAAWAFVWTNVANFILNYLFIYGDEGLERLGLPRIGLPAMGVFGSGLSSTLASVVTVVFIHRAVVRHGGGHHPSDLRSDPATLRRIWAVGFPISMHLLAEVGAFGLAGFFAGWLGPAAVAAHQVALGLASMSFVFALGVANATSVRVGYAVGRGDTKGARLAGFAGMLAGAMMVSGSMCLFAFAPRVCAGILSDQPDVIEAAVPLLRIAAIFQFADATQVIAAAALRGTGDTRSAQVANMIGHYAVGLPLSLLLGFVFHLGVSGIWWGLTAALFGVAIALLVRFFRVSSREIRRL